MSDSPIDQIIAELDRILPAVFARSKVAKITGGLFSSGYLAVLDSEGAGPEGSARCGRHVIYQKKFFLEWLRKRMTTPEERRGVKCPKKQNASGILLERLHDFSKK